MAITRFTGPLHVTGPFDTSRGADIESGPSIFYQGSHLIDPRFQTGEGQAPGTGFVKGFVSSPVVCLVDAVPMTLGAATIFTAATPGAWGAITPKGQSKGFSPAIPFMTPSGTIVTSASTLDMGFCWADTTNGGKSLDLAALPLLRHFYVGQKLIISGAKSANVPLFATVTALSDAGTGAVTIDTAAGVSLTATNVGQADDAMTHWTPYVKAGNGLMYDATQGLCRAVSITNANAGDNAATCTITGYDIWGNAMTEVLAFAGAGLVSGKKAFKHISTITTARAGAGATPAGNLSVGTSDVYGLNIRALYNEDISVSWADAKITATTGFVAAVQTNPSTSALGDVRGTYLVQTSASDAARRLRIDARINPKDLLGATPTGYVSLFGLPQA